MTIETLLAWLDSHIACKESLDFIGNCKTIEEAWEKLDNSEWLCWLFYKLGIFDHIFSGDWDQWTSYATSLSEMDGHYSKSDALAIAAEQMKQVWSLEEVLKAIQETE